MKKNNNNYIKQSMPYLVLLLVIVGIMTFYELSQYKVNVFTYDQFISELDKHDVNKLEITAKSGAGIYYITGTLNGYSDKESFEVNAPLSESVVNRVTEYAESNNITLVTGENPERNNIGGVLLNVIPTVLLVGSMLWLLTKLGKSNNNSMDFGRSKAKLSEEAKAHFSDVAGLTEEKEEVAELIDFLKNPKKFQKMGARIPKGVLLVGPPGTGKTLLAKAVAGEANVPFYYISGSDFVELFVGVGASRVRDMFKQAKQTAPCLIFIDEIDAVGRQRGTGLGGGHDEREQTLNQLLTEMDGFGANEGIIIIAATNRPDVLDPALLRPGRFDRQVTVSLPDQKERLAILNVHAKNKVFGSDVNLENISKRTPGYSGADLENLLNEAALLAVRRNLPAIGMAEIDEASDRVLMGPAKVSRKYSENDKKLVSYHEAGHAVIGLKLEHANVVQKVTIIPRGSAGGYNMMIPSEEKICSTKTDLLEEITGLLGGRTAEELVFGEITTGAHNDFEKATKIARAMVTEYGMSDLGPLQFEQQEGSVFLGRDYNKSHNFSNEVANEIDMEMRKIIDECHAKATEIIKQNMDLLKLIAESLLEQETLTKEEIDYLVANGHLPKDNQEVSGEKVEKVAKTKKKKDNTEKEAAEKVYGLL